MVLKTKSNATKQTFPRKLKDTITQNKYFKKLKPGNWCLLGPSNNLSKHFCRFAKSVTSDQCVLSYFLDVLSGQSLSLVKTEWD